MTFEPTWWPEVTSLTVFNMAVGNDLWTKMATGSHAIFFKMALLLLGSDVFNDGGPEGQSCLRGWSKKKKTKFDDVIFYYLNKKAFIYFIF